VVGGGNKKVGGNKEKVGEGEDEGGSGWRIGGRMGRRTVGERRSSAMLQRILASSDE